VSYSIDGKHFATSGTLKDGDIPSEGYMGMISYASSWSWKNFQILPGKPTCGVVCPAIACAEGEKKNPETCECEKQAEKPASCQCMANGRENERFCEGKNWNVEKCLSNKGKCHWGPNELAECKKEAEEFKSDSSDSGSDKSCFLEEQKGFCVLENGAD